MFIDKEGYGGGDAKLIYTLVSYEYSTGNFFYGVKITDMEKDPRSTSYTVFPDKVVYDGTEYEVVGNIVTSTGDNTFTDVEGDFKLIYTLSDADYVSVSGYSYPDTGPATSVTFPAKITLIDKDKTKKEYKVKQESSEILNGAPISKLTFICPSVNYYRVPVITANSNLQSLKIIVENDNPDASSCFYIDSIYGCDNLTYLWLPNVLGDINISYCKSLGSKATSENPFILNTKIVVDNLTYFHHFAGLKYLELGKNVTQASIQKGTMFSGCPNLEVVYNTAPDVTEDDLAKTIVKSGSKNVLLFNNPGGTFTKYASITKDTSTDPISVTDITMPEGTWTDGTSIPAWTHKDGTAWYHSGYHSEFFTKSFTPWRSSSYVNDYGYYYFAFTPTCTVTYHVYTDGKEVGAAVTQDILSMYNTLLYDEKDYPDPVGKAAMGGKSFTWTSSTGETYRSGQSVTLFGDLDLYLWTDGTKPDTVTKTYKWDYVDITTSPFSVKTYTYAKTQAPGTYEELSSQEFSSNAKDTDNNGMSDAAQKACNKSYQYWVASDGLVCCNEFGICGNVTLYLYASSDFPPIFYYFSEYGSSKSYTPLRLYLNTSGVLTVNPNTSERSDEYFAAWKAVESGFGILYLPGENMVNPDAGVCAYYFNKESKNNQVIVDYSYVNAQGSVVRESGEYDFGEETTLKTFDRPGHRLIGWSYASTPYKPTSGNVNFSLDTPVTMLNYLCLYAVWEEVPPTVITDNLRFSVDGVPTGDYPVSSVFIGFLLDGDKPKYTVTFYDSTGTKVADKPTAVGVYVIKVGYQVFRDGDDVTDEYYSGYVKDTPVTYQCYNAFLTIYSGDHSTVID